MKVSKFIFATLLLLLLPLCYADLSQDINNYYSFDESGVIIIDQINGQNGVLSNPSAKEQGLINLGINTTSNQVIFPGLENYKFLHNGTTWSWSGWVKRNPGNHRGVIFDTHNIGSATIGASLFIGNPGDTPTRFVLTIARGVSGTANTVVYYDQNIFPTTNDWVHIAISYNHNLVSDNLKIYFNGSLVATQNKTGFSPNTNNQTNNMTFGRQAGSSASFFNGIIDEFAFWKKELNSSEIFQLYNNGTGFPFPFGGNILLSVYNATNNQIINYQDVTITNLNSNGQETKTSASGLFVFNIDNFLNNKFTITSAGFDQNEFTFPAGSIIPDNTNIYLFEDSQLVTLSVRDTAFNNIENAYILVEAIVNGQFVNYSSKLTDVTGSAAFNLILDNNYRITVSANGYITRTFNIEVTEQAYTLVLDSVTGFNLDGPITGVFYRYDPKDTVLRDEIVNFTWRAFPDVNNLQYFSIELYNGTTLLQQNINTTSSGGIINILYNVSAFNNTYITAIYRFKKEGFPEFSLPVSYYIDLGGDTAGTVINARAYAQANIPIEIRITIWLFVAFIIVFTLAFYGVLGTKNVMFGLLVSLFPAYFLAVELLPVISIIGMLIISWITNGGRDI